MEAVPRLPVGFLAPVPLPESDPVLAQPGHRWAVSEGLPYWELFRIRIRLFFIPSSNSAEQSILDVNIMDLHSRLALSSSIFKMLVHTFVLFVLSAGLVQRRKEAFLAGKMRSFSSKCNETFLRWGKY